VGLNVSAAVTYGDPRLAGSPAVVLQTLAFLVLRRILGKIAAIRHRTRSETRQGWIRATRW
jgi:hypothetical protein